MVYLLFFYSLIAAFFYLGSRAVITSFLWSRYPNWLAKVMDCAACASFHYTIGLAAFIKYVMKEPLPVYPTSDWSILLLAFGAVAITPILAALQQKSLELLGSAVSSDEHIEEL